MNNFNIVYEQHGKYSAVIYPISYLNPIYEIQGVSTELKNNRIKCGYVLFDLLLSNGNNFNRFAEAYFDGEEINKGTLDIAEMSEEEISVLNRYYRDKTKELYNSVLTSKEQFKYATSK